MAEPIRSLKTTMKSDTPSFDHEPSEIVSMDIAALREEVASLRELFAQKTGEAYEKVADKANSAANYVSHEATSVAGAIREHPAATTTLFGLIGAIGFTIGYVVASTSAQTKQAWYQRYINDRF